MYNLATCKAITYSLFVLIIICAAADIVDTFWPNKAIKIVKPIAFIAAIIAFPVVMDFLVPVDFLNEIIILLDLETYFDDFNRIMHFWKTIFF